MEKLRSIEVAVLDLHHQKPRKCLEAPTSRLRLGHLSHQMMRKQRYSVSGTPTRQNELPVTLRQACMRLMRWQLGSANGQEQVSRIRQTHTPPSPPAHTDGRVDVPIQLSKYQNKSRLPEGGLCCSGGLHGPRSPFASWSLGLDKSHRTRNEHAITETSRVHFVQLDKFELIKGERSGSCTGVPM